MAKKNKKSAKIIEIDKKTSKIDKGFQPHLVGDLTKWERNPRTITPGKAAVLAKTILEYGDLSGVVFNVRNQKLVGGHMRQDPLSSAKIEIVKRLDKPTKQGTVAWGYADLEGERFSYREVDWDEAKHSLAAIAANKSAGEWDLPGLKELLHELQDFEVDLELTGFEVPELTSMLGVVGPKDDLDYSALEGNGVEGAIEKMQEGLRKAIVIDFELDDYAKAIETVKMLKTKGVYIGGLFLEFLETTKKLL